MPEYDDIDLTERELQLAAELHGLGPVMARAARSRIEAPDPTFLVALRGRLVEAESVGPDRIFQHRLRARLVGTRRVFPWRLGLPVGALAAVVLGLLLILHPFTKAPAQRPLAVGVPQPSNQDLTRGYPPPGIQGGGGGYLSPTASRLESAYGAYPARLRLTTGSFPALPDSLPVYQLAVHPFAGTSIAAVEHRLGISGKAICMSPITAQPSRCSRRTWTVVAQHLFPSRQPLHSIAVSSADEVIYHDLAYDQFAYHGPALPRDRTIAIARAWLARLGWPASSMPVLSVGPVRLTGPLNAASPISVTFGWEAGIRSAVPSASLWVAPTGRVVEALLWPPIVRHRIVVARAVADAWSRVQSGRAPVAVEGAVIPLPGRGTASQVTVIQVLVTPLHGPSYLEPAYRFSGKVTLSRGQGVHLWYALVPAVARR